MSGVEAFCCFTHTAQSLGHSFPALRRARVGFHDVLLGPRPSLISAEDCSSLFDRFTGTVTRSDSSGTCLPAVRLTAFSGRSRPCFDREVPEVSRFSCMLFLSIHIQSQGFFACGSKEVERPFPVSPPGKAGAG